MPERTCHLCREETSSAAVAVGKPGKNRAYKVTCERCQPLVSAPPCGACGKRVRDASWNDVDVFHDLCRRCSSCSQVIPKPEMVRLAGHLLCSSCDHLFGKFFVPGRRTAGDMMKDAFSAWDHNDNGTIEIDELRRVMKGLKPDFPDRDLDKVMRIVDSNGNGVIEYQEFVEWIMQGAPLDLVDSFQDTVDRLMREAGQAAHKDGQEIAEVMVRPDGLVFRLRSGQQKFETRSLRNDEIMLAMLEPEEFICKVEFTEDGLRLGMNTGRVATLALAGDPFGPWVAPTGFHIVGLRAKPPAEDDGDRGDRIVGVDLTPLPDAKTYDSPAALRYAAEHEYLYTLREMVSKAAVDLNSFSPGGSTALMLAAQHGNVGAMRLLISSKAKVDVEDAEGWTALRFASRFGHTTAVDLLLDKGAQEHGDNNDALSEALRHRHNSTARALLRAGFGPAPQGTFALEELPDESSFTLPGPTTNPPGSVFHGPVVVELSFTEEKGEQEDAEEPEADDEQPTDLGNPNEGAEAAEGSAGDEVKVAAAQEVTILYTTDGRDPFAVGRRYRGPLTLSAARTHLRAVAVRGSERSRVIDEIFAVCHYAIPDDVITGSLQVRGFQEMQPILNAGLMDMLKLPSERLQTECEEADSVTHYGQWLRIPVHDPVPKHSLKIDRSFAQVRGKEKLAAFVEAFHDDVCKAVGMRPENVSVAADHRGGRARFRPGCIQVEFGLPRDEAKNMVSQLGDESSYLLSRAKLRGHYQESELQLVLAIGDRLMEQEVIDGLTVDFRKKIAKGALKEVIGSGAGDRGTIGLAMARGAAKPQPAVVKKVVNAALPEYPGIEVGEADECPEEFVLNYTIDAISSKSGEGLTASSLIRDLSASGVMDSLMSLLRDKSLNVDVEQLTMPSSRGLAQLEFQLEWSMPAESTSKDLLDGICMVYSGSHLSQVIDFRSCVEDHAVHDGESTGEVVSLCRSISRAVRHSGDERTTTGGEHRIAMDLDALPLGVTDLYFVLACCDGRNLSQFKDTRVQINDAVLGRRLTDYSVSAHGKDQAVVLCKLARDPDHSKWCVYGLGFPATGSINDYGPLRSMLAEKQDGYCRWYRRKDLVLLRALHKERRLTECATNEFAQLLWRLLKMPIPAFQVVVKWF
mmetsp:Transcript_117177/g.304044  ORF Transcript_117177/g.304044 Transcript_117177/m.304044 type:complete len:1140 (-) Transcript_117177:186-3605(-)